MSCHPWHHSHHLQWDRLMLRLYLRITRSWLCCGSKAGHLYNSTHPNGSIEENICDLSFTSPAGNSILPNRQEDKGLWHWHLIVRKIRRLNTLNYLDIYHSLGRETTMSILKQSFFSRNSTLNSNSVSSKNTMSYELSSAIKNEKRAFTAWYSFCSKITA